MLPLTVTGFIDIRWLDVVDVVLVAILIYQLYHLVKGTVAIKIFVGIFAIYLFWKLVEALQMKLLSEILGQFIGVGVIALIIVFQQEIRRFLILIGTTGFFSNKGPAKRLFNWKWKKENEIRLNISDIVKSCKQMAKTRTGALIVLTRTSELTFYTSSGVQLGAEVSGPLIESIFYKNTPLHDGAIIITNNHIVAARCVLPVSENKEIPGSLGMRHRAAIGVTENSDAFAITVSEQNGSISVAEKGEIETGISLEELERRLKREFSE